MRKNDYADERQSKLYTKFPSTHYLSNPKNVDHTLLWNTFFRRNLHRLAIDYLGIKLHLYQAIILYLMGISQFTVIIACRAAAKSFIISLWACCVCITRPFSKIVLSSGTKGQAKLIISEKIKNELMSMSPTLCKEILSIKDNQNDVIVYFKNGSTITVVVAGENGRGHRSNAVVREEFRQIDKKVDDSILSPFQTIRQAPYMIDTFYSGMTELQEEPVDIYISSSWYDNGHWMWDIVKQAQDEMLNSENYTACLLAFDESITLKHTIRSQKQMQKEKRKQDPLTWRLEFLNERIKENSAAFFTYKMFTDNQRNKKPFYPRSNSDVLMKKKNPYAIPKQQGEIRLVACDMAFVENKKNDNSVFSCIRLIPESRTYTIQSENGSKKEVNQGYRKIVSYLEPIQGGDTVKQAIRIKQLFEDFEADYTILDLRNGGIVVYDLLAKIMYDEERDKEYQPWVCMNDESVANRIKTVGALPILFAISASQKLNSEIALEFQTALTTNMIDFLVPLSEAQETILSKIPEYNTTVDTDLHFFYEKPFLETQALINESTSLIYERKEQTGAIVISEQGNNRKDRYTSVSYGNHFASLLEQDLLSDNSDYDYGTFIN
jgi:predicted DNA-binding antitoxin AbrB/MazE fold protein